MDAVCRERLQEFDELCLGQNFRTNIPSGRKRGRRRVHKPGTTPTADSNFITQIKMKTKTKTKTKSKSKTKRGQERRPMLAGDLLTSRRMNLLKLFKLSLLMLSLSWLSIEFHAECQKLARVDNLRPEGEQNKPTLIEQFHPIEGKFSFCCCLTKYSSECVLSKARFV